MLETWQVTLIAAGASLFGALVGAAIAFITNAQRLRAENHRFWNERIIQHATRIYEISEVLNQRKQGEDDDPQEVIDTMKEQLALLEAEMLELQFIAPESVNRSAVDLHLMAMALLMFRTAGHPVDDIKATEAEFRANRSKFIKEVKKQLGIDDRETLGRRFRKWRQRRANKKKEVEA